VVESSGSTRLILASDNTIYLYNNGGSELALKNGGSTVTAQANGWTPIGAEQTATGYEVVWKYANNDQYSVWETDSNANYVSSNGTNSGASSAVESLESKFQQDLNGDGGIGIPTQLNFGTSVSDENLWFVRSGNDLQIDIIGTTNHQTVSNWVTAGGNQALQITAGGLKLDSQVSQLVQAMATYSASNPAFDPTSSSVLAVPSDTSLQNSLAAAWHA
jgi:hypothetical protein